MNLLIRTLDERADRARFASGAVSLDDWLRRQAGQAQRKRLASVWIAATPADASTIVGYYSLAPWQIAFEDAPAEVTRRLPKYPLAAILLARLAVDRRWQGRGVGGVLLVDALARALAASVAVPVQLFIVHAKDEATATFYEKHGLRRFPKTPLHLFIPMASLSSRLIPKGSDR